MLIKNYLEETDIVDFSHPIVATKAKELAALLRANNIPTGFCYQRLSCSEYKDNIYCLLR